MNKIKEAFAGKKAIIPYITCGDPNLETTAAAIRAATGLPVFLVDNPLACVACGSGKMLSSLDKNRHILQTMY